MTTSQNQLPDSLPFREGRGGAIRAILINVISQTVTEVFTEPTYQAYYALIGCDCITGFSIHHPTWASDSFCYVDDEGLLKNPFDGFFQFTFMSEPFAGNGLIVGTDAAGNDISTVLDVKHIQENIKFWKAEQALQMLAEIEKNNVENLP